jgi:hypothetical protein
MTARLKQITKLTPEQEARFPEFVRKWIDIGLSTEPADRDRAERAIAGLYDLAKLRRPRVIWLPCPISAALSAVCYAAIINKRLVAKGGTAVYSAVGSAGFSYFGAGHGVRVPDHWLAARANLDPNEVIKSENVEQRAAGAAIVGWPKMLSVLKAKVIDDSGNDDIGQLIELKLPGLREAGRFLRARCPRNGTIVEGVPRVSDIDGLPIDTALAAQAWRIGDPQAEYAHPPMRT